MADHRDGTRFTVPASRRLTWDLLRFNRHVPLCGHDRRCDLSPIESARRQCPVRVSWPALVMKAVSLVADEIPELRQTWYRWPWNHIYQHAFSVGIVTVQREHEGEPWLFWGKIVNPSQLPLIQIQSAIDVFRDGPVEKTFRRQQELAALPTFLRRMVWWWNLNVETARRAKRLGTFFLSTLSGRGAEIQIPPSIHTTCVTYGPLDENGNCRLTIAYDHRVMDGAIVADALARIEQTLNETLRDELLELSVSQAA